MEFATNRLPILLQRYLNNTCTGEEFSELLALWPVESDSNEIETTLLNELKNASFHPTEKQVDWEAMLAKIVASPLVKQTPVRKLSAFRQMAAAIIILICGGYFWYMRAQKNQIKTSNSPTIVHDIAPGGNKAILTLGNGKHIILDSTANDLLSQQGNTEIIKLDSGRLSYAEGKRPPRNTSHEVYNTLSTPRGGQYQLTLNDGTRVWLNSASSITYPTVFSAKERSVSIEGEAYLEVAKDKSKPFHVTVNGGTIEVLGTSFNINAYSDEPVLQTTLLEGSISITHGSDKKILSPGEQAIIKDSIQIDPHVDQEQVIAWKSGIFNFNRVTLKEAMRQLARWYDVETEYPAAMANKKFGGEMGRDLTLAQVLRLMDGLDDMHFKLEGRKIIAFP